MRGISDLDSLCLREIFKNLPPLDLCSVRHCSKGLQSFVEDYFHSVHFTGEKLLDLTAESNENTSKILKQFGKFCRNLKVHQKTEEEEEDDLVLDVMLNVIVTNCGKYLKRLSLNSVHIYDIDMVKFKGVFDNLEFLELINCDGDEQCIEFEYPNLTTLRIIKIRSPPKHGSESHYRTSFHETLNAYLMNETMIKRRLHDDLLPLIALNAPAIEKLDIWIDRDTRNLISMAQLKNLKLLQINCMFDDRLITSLIRELSVCSKLEIMSLSKRYSHYNEEFWDALSNLTNLKQIRLNGSYITIIDDRSMKMLFRKLLKLESFMFVDCFNLRYLDFFELVCKSDKVRKVYIWETQFNIDSCLNILQIIKDFTGARRHSCFVTGTPLCIYLENHLFNAIKIFLTPHNVNSIEKYGNIKIIRAKPDDFSVF